MKNLKDLTNEQLNALIKDRQRHVGNSKLLDMLSYEVLRRCIFENKENNLPKVEDK